MRQFIKSALNRLDKLSPGQMQNVVLSAADEISRLETLLDSLSEGILVCDAGHNLILANKYALRLLPINSFEQEREPVWNLVGEEQIASFLERTLKSGDRADDREFDSDFNGNLRVLSLSVWPLVQKQTVSGSLVHIADITEKRVREARMRRMENLASLTTVAAGVAHEIKNPLGSLSIHVQLIQKAFAPLKSTLETNGSDSGLRLNTIDRYLSVINEEIDRLNQIVVDFLFAVRPMDLDLRLGNVNSLLRELTEFVSPELKESGIECVLELADDIPFIKYDERHLKQALLNLIKNAIAAMSSGGTITVASAIRDSGLAIVISDTGIGIPEENLSKIFEPYFTTRESGTGLGLTLVFKIIREHQGEINVKSKPGKGSSFVITLPIPQNERKLIGAPE